jgi:hypothetical protein
MLENEAMRPLTNLQGAALAGDSLDLSRSRGSLDGKYKDGSVVV